MATEAPTRTRGFGPLVARLYDIGAQWPPTARLGAWIEWGADLDRMYESMAAIGELPPGATVLDVPCGGGLAFRALSATQDVRYVAVDASPAMVERATARARRLGLDQVEVVEGDAGSLPLGDATVDLCLTYNGLQCFPDPQRAVAEMFRCLRPGARLVGSTVVVGELRRADRVVEMYRRMGAFAEGGTPGDLLAWLDAAGFVDVEHETSGALATFRATRPAS